MNSYRSILAKNDSITNSTSFNFTLQGTTEFYFSISENYQTILQLKNKWR